MHKIFLINEEFDPYIKGTDSHFKSHLHGSSVFQHVSGSFSRSQVSADISLSEVEAEVKMGFRCWSMLGT